MHSHVQKLAIIRKLPRYPYVIFISTKEREPGYIIGLCGIERYNNHLKHQKKYLQKKMTEIYDSYSHSMVLNPTLKEKNLHARQRLYRKQYNVFSMCVFESLLKRN